MLNAHFKAIRKANKIEEEMTSACEDVCVSGDAR